MHALKSNPKGFLAVAENHKNIIIPLIQPHLGKKPNFLGTHALVSCATVAADET
jgi:hypothetical protein